MPKLKAPLLRRAHRGEEGVTLIELLIVVTILGVIATVIIVATAPYSGKGHVEAANTELHNLQVGIATGMSDLDAGGVTPGNVTKDLFSIEYTGVPPTIDPSGKVNITLNAANTIGNATYGPYFAGSLRADYWFDQHGTILGAKDQLWGGITWDYSTSKWTKA